VVSTPSKEVVAIKEEGAGEAAEGAEADTKEEVATIMLEDILKLIRT